MDPLANLDSLRLKPGMTGKPKPMKRPPRHRGKERFVKGPIPWSWIERAAPLPGKVAVLAWVLWQAAGYSRDRTVKLNLSRVELGLTRQAAQRAIHQLELAGLVTVERRPGRGLLVTIQD